MIPKPMSVARYTIVTLFVAACLLGMPCLAQTVSWHDAVDMARKQLHGAVMERRPLEAARVPGARQDLWHIQQPVQNPSVKLRDIEFFRISPVSFEVSSGKVVSIGGGVDGTTPNWLIAFDGDSGTWFYLAGFPQANSEFNRLMQLLQGIVTTDAMAREIAFYYMEIACDSSVGDSLVVDELTLQIEAARDFRRRYPEKEAVTRYNQWRSRLLAGRRPTMAIVVERQKTGDFNVKYSRFTVGRLIRETIAVHPNGTVSGPTLAP